jgi:transposase
MKTLHRRCAGLDVHKDTVVACVRRHHGNKVEHDVRTFSTTTSQLLKLWEWLEQNKCTHVAMEATGVYWKPVWHVLAEGFELVLANAAHIRNVPGRKSDVNDATWIADLLAHGLIRASMVPPEPILELRDLTRTRRQYVREIVQHKQRIYKTLEDANVKLGSVVSDVLGMSGRRIVEAIIAGERDAERLAALGSGRLRCTREQLTAALYGRITDHHRFMLRQHLHTIDGLQASVRVIEERIEECLRPFGRQLDLLKTIPGVSQRVAEVIISEIGLDMHRFPTSGHLLSWAGLCPRLDESAGHKRSVRLRKGGRWLKADLVQSAWAATRRPASYTQAQFLRLRARRGPKKAIVAVAASILTAAYHILRNDVPYHDLGADHFTRHDRTKTVNRLARRIRQLGYEVELRPAA